MCGPFRIAVKVVSEEEHFVRRTIDLHYSIEVVIHSAQLTFEILDDFYVCDCYNLIGNCLQKIETFA